ncbi:hypothetical protein FZ983_27760 [Azospirillum sp. B21]|uniref:tubulin-like doman-containing protein n=1 Tax=Azospirillum sp. B21 TaxID=2607496 RepID=UPI0011EC0D82|nr:tubulin-like doman-containing protein [Azospirillum sp. B21]KAA0574342.1 hypothetical protein FZ983_27760 [Azospirillum sp. B21]
MADETVNSLRQQRPVLLIGVGGTGKQVLLNLRRMFFDQYGKATLPHIGHIWIDTDPSNLTLDGEDMNFLLKEVDFEATERVNTELRPADLQNYYEHKSDHPHIFSWFDPSLEKHGRIENGAGAIRCFGKLAFFHYYKEIMSRVREKYAQIRDAAHHATLMTDYGIQVDASKVETWLIFSVAGGTGSGMFLDLAFALKEADPNVGLQAIMLLPSVFSSDFQHRIFGNSYAALMELEHYNLAKTTGGAHRFPVAWTREQYESNQHLDGPAFSTAYLVGNKPRGSGGTLALKDKNSLCEMLAETLFIRYGGATQPLAAEGQSKRSNFDDYLTGIVKYQYTSVSGGDRSFTEEFSCRYSSLGLSKLHIPVQRIATLVRHQLAVDLVQHWLHFKEIPNNFDDLVTRQYLPRLRLGDRGRDGHFYRELIGVGQGQTVEETLRQTFQTGRAAFLQGAAQPDIGERLQSWLNSTILVQQLDIANPDPSRWGLLSRLVTQQHSDQLFAKVSSELDSMVREILSAHAQRIPFAREVLRRVAVLLDEQRRDFEELAERARTRAAGAMRDIAERLGWLADCTGQRTRRTIIDVVLDFAEERAVFELRAQVCTAGAKISERLADLIGRGTLTRDAKGQEQLIETGLLKQLADLERLLDRDLRAAIAARVDGLRRLQSSAIYQNLYEEHDFQDFYVMPDGRRIDGGALADLDRRFFEDAEPGRPRSLWDMRQVLQTEGNRRTIEELLDFTRSVTRHLEDRTVDVVERLSRQSPPDSPQYIAMVQRLLDYGQPWLDNATHFINDTVSMRNVQEKVIVALSKKTPTQIRTDFERTLGKKWKEPLAGADSTPDRVYVSSELAAFPLMAIPDLDRYRNASYFPHLQRGFALHTDVNFEKFQDLLLKRQEEVDSYLTALETLGAGILAGVVIGRMRNAPGSRHGVTEFFFADKRGFFNETLPLGVFSLAVRKLCSADGFEQANAIRAATAERLGDLTDEELGHWLFLLYYSARNNPVGHAGFAAVLNAMAREQEMANPGIEPYIKRAGETLNHWSEENPQGSGFRCLPVPKTVLV